MALFAFEELTFRYPEAPRDALRDVSVAIEPGQFVLVCGQSGCGKTTLLRQFKSALAPHGHQSGQVLFDGIVPDLLCDGSPVPSQFLSKLCESHVLL